MTKPQKVAIGVGFAGLASALLALRAPGASTWPLAWTSLSCAVATGAYLANWPEVYGKRQGRLVWWRALPSAVFLAAFRVSCALMRAWRRHPSLCQVTPNLWVAGRITGRDVPAEVDVVVDLVSEFPEPRAVRTRPGYRFLPVLDGGVPPRDEPVLQLLDELADPATNVLVHCDSGIGRAPTFAALVLVRRGDATDVDAAIALIERARPFVHLGRAERAFLARIEPRLRTRQPDGETFAAAS